MADQVITNRIDGPQNLLDAEGASPGLMRTSQDIPALAPAVAPDTPVSLPRTGEVLPPRKSRKRFIFLSLLLAGGGIGLWQGYNWYTIGRFIVSTDDAYVKADISTIAAKVPGYISSVSVRDNMPVKAGDLLARIDDGDYLLAVDAARRKIDTQAATIERIVKQAEAQKSMIAQAKAQLLAAQADATRAASEMDRTIKLVQSSFGTQQRLDQARADRDRTNAAVQQAEAAIASAYANLAVLDGQKREADQGRFELETSLDKALRDLSFTEIRAPFNGVIGNRAVQPGQYVQPGTRLLALVPLSSIYVEANFKETQLGRLKPGQKVNVFVDAFSDRGIEGNVESFAPASGAQFSLLPPENATGNFTKVVQRLPVRIKVPTNIAEEGLLRPGLSVVVQVRTKPNDADGAMAAESARPEASDQVSRQ
jgi:membrane fusion protein (multidrug efflux system)